MSSRIDRHLFDPPADDAQARGRRVAMISTHTSPLALPGTAKAGGMNVYVRELARQLADMGWQVDIYTRRHDPSLPEVAGAGSRVQVVHVDAGPALPLPPLEVAAHIDVFTEAAAQIAQRRGWRYDLVHSHYWVSGLSGAALAQRWRCPHATMYHTLGAIKNRHRSDQSEPEFRILGERRVAACSDAVICATAHERDFLVEAYGADPDRIEIVPVGVHLANFTPGDRAAARDRVRKSFPSLNLSGEHPAILFVGRLEPLKGADLLIQALAELESTPAPNLWIVGGDERDQNEQARLLDLAAELGVAERVQLAPAAPHAEMPDLYRAADICAVPSLYESFGLVAVEAMACGTPVVATRVGGLEITVRDGVGGFLAQPRTAAAFAQHLAALLADPDRRRRMSAAAVADMQRFAWPAVARSIRDIYEGLIRANRAAPPDRSPCADAESPLAVVG